MCGRSGLRVTGSPRSPLPGYSPGTVLGRATCIIPAHRPPVSGYARFAMGSSARADRISLGPARGRARGRIVSTAVRFAVSRGAAAYVPD